MKLDRFFLQDRAQGSEVALVDRAPHERPIAGAGCAAGSRSAGSRRPRGVRRARRRLSRRDPRGRSRRGGPSATPERWPPRARRPPLRATTRRSRPSTERAAEPEPLMRARSDNSGVESEARAPWWTPA
jgi:hypothetical protein